MNNFVELTFFSKIIIYPYTKYSLWSMYVKIDDKKILNIIKILINN